MKKRQTKQNMKLDPGNTMVQPPNRTTRIRRALVWMKNMLMLTLSCIVSQSSHAENSEGQVFVIEGAFFHPEGSFALEDFEWIVVYDVPTKRFEQASKRVSALMEALSRLFEKVNVKPFLEYDKNHF